MNVDIENVIKKLESKHTDCIEFSKKHKSRKMDDLVQYYDGASWALKFAISLLKEKN